MSPSLGRTTTLATTLLTMFAVTILSVFQGPAYSSPLSSSPSTNDPISRHYRNKTTIIITSSFIPSHPSLLIINQTIESLRYIQGLPSNTPIFITVDGVDKKRHAKDARREIQKKKILDQYIEALQGSYSELNFTILTQPTRVNLVGNVQKAIKRVKTEFIYLIQHDMPFISEINHLALMQTFQDFPDEVRLVRFSPRQTLTRSRDKLGLCGDDLDVVANGIALAKTHTWSDK